MRTLETTRALFGILLCSASTASATRSHGALPIVIRHDRELQASLELAKPFDNTLRFEPDGCGTLIDKRWVLTAAHVAHELSPFNPVIFVQGKPRLVRQVLFHPKSASRGQRPPEVDLALVELDEPTEGIRPAGLYRGDAEVGAAVTVVGYGDFGVGNQELQFTDGRRRAATNRVEKAESGQLHLTFDAPPSGSDLEGVGGPGDSGGPLFMANDQGRFLVGVSSASMGGRPGSYGVIDMYTRVSAYIEWIDSSMKRAREMPPAKFELQSLEDGFPAGSRGELASQWLDALAMGELEGYKEFAERWCPDDLWPKERVGAFIGRLSQLHTDVGFLEPHKLARLSDRRWAVLAQSEQGDWYALHLYLAQQGDEVRLDDFDIRPERSPLTATEPEGKNKDAPDDSAGASEDK